MEITVLDKFELERKEICNKSVVISITNVGEQFTQLKKDCQCQSITALFMQFDDVLENEKHCMTREHAKILSSFIQSIPLDTTELIVSCNGGVSRSPAIAAAAMLYFGMNDMEIWSNGKFCPNEHVFRLMITELLEDIHKDVNIQNRIDINLAIWKEMQGLE